MSICTAPLHLKRSIFQFIPSQSFMSLRHQRFSILRATAGQREIYTHYILQAGYLLASGLPKENF